MGLPHRGECLLEQAAELLAERARAGARAQVPACLQELHLSGRSGACARASWPAAAVARAQDDLARANDVHRCACGGLEDPKRPHRRCRLSAS